MRVQIEISMEKINLKILWQSLNVNRKLSKNVAREKSQNYFLNEVHLKTRNAINCSTVKISILIMNKSKLEN